MDTENSNELTEGKENIHDFNTLVEIIDINEENTSLIDGVYLDLVQVGEKERLKENTQNKDKSV